LHAKITPGEYMVVTCCKNNPGELNNIYLHQSDIWWDKNRRTSIAG